MENGENDKYNDFNKDYIYIYIITRASRSAASVIKCY